MRSQAKWFRSATMMAFLAVVALFVSPVLALACCCDSDTIPQTTRLVQSAPAPHGCCPSEAVSQPVTYPQTLACAEYSAPCGCHHELQNAPFTALDSQVFTAFLLVALALPSSAFEFSFTEDVRLAVFNHASARPRSPDINSASGRAPPALAPS